MPRALLPEPHSPFRDAVDPSCEFPPIMLMPSNERRYTLTARDYNVISDENEVGKVTIVYSGFPNFGEQFLTQFQLTAEERRRTTLGLAVMVLAAERAHAEGDILRTHPNGEHLFSVLLWQTLVDRGVAKVVEPFETRQLSKGGQSALAIQGHIRTTPDLFLHR